MADGSSLDDFFAKKDKSKKKGKSKVMPNDLLEKQKVKKKKTTSEKKKEENKPQSVEVDPAKLTGLQGDEDWLEVEEEEKDYTGLRIQTLQITQEKEEEEKESEEKGSDEEDDESGEKKEVASGPWGKVEAPAPAPAPQKPPEPEPEPAKKDDTPAKPAKYIPPGARQAAAATAHTQLIGPGMGPRRRGKAAPNLESEEDFPTLGTEAPVIDSAWGGKFEKVKGGGRQMDDPSSKGPQLSLGNKYTALQGGTD